MIGIASFAGQWVSLRVQSTIEARNAARVAPYLWLLPDRITNSTSI